MKIKTKNGAAEALPLSDIQENTRWLKLNFYLSLIIMVFIMAILCYIVMNFEAFRYLFNTIASRI